MQLKNCSKCKQEKNIKLFKKSGHNNNKYSSWCKSCDNYAHRLRRANRTSEQKECDQAKMRAYNKQYYYGISQADYDAMLLAQNGLCAICEKEETRVIKGTKSKLSVDHCHVTSNIRALLCDVCNKTLGLWKDNPETFRKAANYLEYFNDLYTRS